MRVVTVSGYKPFEIGIFKNDAPAVGYIKMALKNNLLNLLEGGLGY